ncbi:hypothetical protein P5673_032968 [Acropora cervicornis]|uniref:Uncharacterized protein n=1 Tax=Acropora cervicornis TaxID=6130 RepID=A0AAD9PQJ2_ACRCE|nr:hypothetical protein P5673_032968 [Acropora cervicornis]
MERHKFKCDARTQKQGEPFKSFVADLRILAATCGKELLKERDLTLDCTTEIGIVNELSDRDNTELSSLPAVYKDEVQSVGRERKCSHRKKHRNLMSVTARIVAEIIQ